MKNNMWSYQLGTNGHWQLLLDGHIAGEMYRPEDVVKKMVDALNTAILTEHPDEYDEPWYDVEKFRDMGIFIKNLENGNRR